MLKLKLQLLFVAVLYSSLISAGRSRRRPFRKNDTTHVDKKLKFNEETYNEHSKEELIQIIKRLKDQISKKNDKPQSPPKSRKKSKRPFDFSKHIALKMLYLGWDYHGLVTQLDNENGIEKYLFEALIKSCLIEDRNKCNYHRCGRTDKGVSSFSQVISITVRSSLKDGQTDDEELPYCKMLNALLPRDIRVISWAPVPQDFSARYSCKKRTYKYWFPLGDLDIEKMNEALKSIIGVHDFRNLCKMDVKNGITIFTREIFEARVSLQKNRLSSHDPISKSYSMCELTIIGKGFLWHQIRAIVTVLFLVGQARETVNIFSELLNIDKCPKKPVYGLADPLPLNLYGCEYDDVNWRTDQEELKKITDVLQSFWTCSAVKCAMIENMIVDLSDKNELVTANDRVYATLLHDSRSKVYKPLMSRATEEGLENRINYHQGKGRLKWITTPST
ncbi:tRNA pseudouridine(38/39) synthase isoform X2 [Planococcus citri]|uniref:tRNA pseudouridine(38/39) synthase isoform X2 n=1 Tax=Planococcus citri TaxID=170843 RepID=UPI0031F7B7BB